MVGGNDLQNRGSIRAGSRLEGHEHGVQDREGGSSLSRVAFEAPVGTSSAMDQQEPGGEGLDLRKRVQP